MLNNNQSVKLLRLKTGEDVLSQIVGTGPDNNGINHIELNHPLRVIYMQLPIPGVYSMSLREWVFSKVTAHQNITINSNDVLFIIEPNEEAIGYYFSYLKEISNISKEEKELGIDEIMKATDISIEDKADVIRERVAEKNRERQFGNAQIQVEHTTKRVLH
jgi:hypothetical protein